MQKPIINILIRTSKRPKYFAECMKSIINQTSSNGKIIVYTDDKESHETYLKNIKHIYSEEAYLKKQHQSPNSLLYAPYNEYLNEMLESVSDEEGVMILDDDDCFLLLDGIDIITNNISTNEDLLLWKVRFPHATIPNDLQFGKNNIVRNNVSMIGFCVNKSIFCKNKEIRFGSSYTGDFDVINAISSLPDIKKIGIDSVITGLQRDCGGGGRGGQDDK